MSDLVYPKLWWSAAVGFVVLVVYLSVADLSMPQVGFDFSDKLNHVLAYGFLMGWCGQLVQRWRPRLYLIVFLCCLGIAMEFVQGALPHRWFDWLDALANATGILIAAIALYFGADQILKWVEKKILR